jgi:cytoskeletal protein CcmA (bactofilin family)
VKRIRIVIVTVVVFGLSTLAWVGLAHAQGFRTGSNGSLSQGQTVDGTFYSMGRTIDIGGTVNGDVLCAGQSVSISGTIHGDVLCAAQTIDISGKVDGSIRAAAQTVNIRGQVGRNVSVAAQSFTIHTTAKIAGDVSAAANTANLNGSIGRDLAATGSSLTIAGSIGRNLKANTPSLTFTSDARVQGSANYISNNDATLDSGAVVKQLTHTTPSKPTHRRLVGSLLGLGLGWLVYVLLAALFGSLVLVLLLPQFLHQVTEQTVKHLGMSILTGFLAGIAVFVLLIALSITLIGIPLGLLLVLAWLLVVALSLPVTAYYLGSMILSKIKNPIPPMLLGTLILVVLTFLPIVGALIFILAVWIGAGSLLRYLYQRWPKPKYKL